MGYRSAKGVTMLELLVVLGMLGVIFSIAFINLRPLSNPLQNSVAQTSGFLRQVRTKAMASTSAYRVLLRNNQTLYVEYAFNCAGGGTAGWREDRSIKELTLTENVVFTNTATPLLCFNSRGQSDTALILTLRNPENKTRTVQVLLAGGIQTP